MMKFLKEHFDLRDLHAYTGILLITAGCFFVYRPAALIVPGIILVWMAMRGGK